MGFSVNSPMQLCEGGPGDLLGATCAQPDREVLRPPCSPLCPSLGVSWGSGVLLVQPCWNQGCGSLVVSSFTARAQWAMGVIGAIYVTLLGVTVLMAFTPAAQLGESPSHML